MTTKIGQRGEVAKDTVPTGIASTAIDSTNWTQIGDADGYDMAKNPTAAAILDWTIGSGTTLDVRLKVSVDGENYSWAPSYGVPVAGESDADIAQITFTATDWDVGGGVSRLPVAFHVPEFPFYQLWVKSDNASGSVEGTLGGGVGE